MKAFFLSDIHIKDPQESNSQTLLLFLSQILKDPEATHLFLVGDIFDLWVEDHQYFKHRYHDIVEAIQACVHKGIEVHYFEGNHDLYLKKFWQDQVGAKVHEGPTTFDLGPWKVRVEHGDQMNPEDRGYLWLRWFLRTKAMSLVAKNMPQPLIRKIGESASTASRSYSSRGNETFKDKVRKMNRNYAEKVYGEGLGFDFIISGHTHVQDDYAFERSGKTARSINLGSWFEEPKALVLNKEKAIFSSI